jgi:hypothetical protein
VVGNVQSADVAAVVELIALHPEGFEFHWNEKVLVHGVRIGPERSAISTGCTIWQVLWVSSSFRLLIGNPFDCCPVEIFVFSRGHAIFNNGTNALIAGLGLVHEPWSAAKTLALYSAGNRAPV